MKLKQEEQTELNKTPKEKDTDIPPVPIPTGTKVGKFVSEYFRKSGIINEKGELTEPLEVRVFNRDVANILVKGGLDSKDGMTWTWPYDPDKWEYNEQVVDNPNHPGGFVFYKRSGLEHVPNQPGKRRFLVPYREALKAIFIQQFP